LACGACAALQDASSGGGGYGHGGGQLSFMQYSPPVGPGP
jgi:hypothetical protein